MPYLQDANAPLDLRSRGSFGNVSADEMASQNLKRKKLPHFYESEGVFYLFGFPRNYLFELSETAFDTRKVQICLATSETLKTSLRRVISLKYRLNTGGFQQVASRGATWAHC